MPFPYKHIKVGAGRDPAGRQGSKNEISRVKVGRRDRGKAIAALHRSWVCSPNREHFRSYEFLGWTSIGTGPLELILIDLVLYGGFWLALFLTHLMIVQGPEGYTLICDHSTLHTSHKCSCPHSVSLSTPSTRRASPYH